MLRIFTFLFAALFFAAAVYAQSNSASEGHGSEITVSAEANIYANPDIAEINLSIITRQLKATEAFKTYLTRYNALVGSLREIIDTTELKTNNLSITPSFNYQKPDQIIPDYYQVSSSMSISVRLSKLNDVLGRIALVDGVTINGVIFQSNDLDLLETKALEEAVKKANDKAEAIAQLEGLTNLKVKSISTSYSHPPVPLRYSAVMATEAPSVNPSTVSVSANVTATYTESSK